MSDFVVERVGAAHADLDFRPPLESSIVNPITGEVFHDEVDEVLGHIARAIDGIGERRYVAAIEESGLVLGVMGFRRVGEAEDPMQTFVTEKPALEIVNAMSIRDQRGKGVGYMTLHQVLAWGEELGYKQVVLNSGPRYRRGGWPFWRRQFGDPIATIPDFYGKGFHAPVWRHDLSR